MSKAETLFFCGIGGSGMSALASILRQQGRSVAGSDRGYDRGQTPEKFAALKDFGIQLFPQDGSGLTADTAQLVVSSAIENSIPDVKAAIDRGIPIFKRADILAEMFNATRGIAVGGTSGKTTVTGMAGHILHQAGLDPSVINGGVMVNFGHNFHTGRGDWLVAETDESDGSIALFEPEIAILNNITLDHMPIESLRPLFAAFVAKARLGAVINADDEEAARLVNEAGVQVLTFGIGRYDVDLTADHILFRRDHCSFDVFYGREKAMVDLPVPGMHNVSNALAAIGAALKAGVPLAQAATALAGFRGIHRRLEFVGEVGGIGVIDDFAHNPDKVAASLDTLKTVADGRLLIMFQPHGYGPMRMMRRELMQAFAHGMGEEDILMMPEIFYAGGTASRDMSASDLIADLEGLGKNGLFLPTRELVGRSLLAEARPGDRIVIMGARDDTLPIFARDLLAALGSK